MEEVYIQFQQEDGPELEVATVEYVEDSDLISEAPSDDRDFVYKCNACNMSFHSVEDHIREHHQEEQVMVEVEEEVNERTFGFVEVSDDEEVSVVHRDVFECIECHTKLKSARSLKMHLRMHEKRPGGQIRNQRENHCHSCNRSFSNAEHFQLHMAGHENHDLESEQSKSGLFGDVYEEELVLAERGNDGYPCNYCGKKFKRPNEKVKHERIHTGERPYACETCGKRFRVASCLAVHRRTHEDSRPFVCPHCKKTFKLASAYNHHLKTHSTDRGYRCKFCPKTFKTAVSLNGHEKTHTKPFPCHECGRAFGSLYLVRMHLEQVHQNASGGDVGVKQNHACELCGAIYGRHAALRDHIRNEHQELCETTTDCDEIVEEECIVMEDGS